jgi:hypothetical protein
LLLLSLYYIRLDLSIFVSNCIEQSS